MTISIICALVVNIPWSTIHPSQRCSPLLSLESCIDQCIGHDIPVTFAYNVVTDHNYNDMDKSNLCQELADKMLVDTPDPTNTTIMRGYLWLNGFQGNTTSQKDNSVLSLIVATNMLKEHVTSSRHTGVLVSGCSMTISNKSQNTSWPRSKTLENPSCNIVLSQSHFARYCLVCYLIWLIHLNVICICNLSLNYSLDGIELQLHDNIQCQNQIQQACKLIYHWIEKSICHMHLYMICQILTTSQSSIICLVVYSHLFRKNYNPQCYQKSPLISTTTAWYSIDLMISHLMLYKGSKSAKPHEHIKLFLDYTHLFSKLVYDDSIKPISKPFNSIREPCVHAQST